jgi:hypothetical protein
MVSGQLGDHQVLGVCHNVVDGVFAGGLVAGRTMFPTASLGDGQPKHNDVTVGIHTFRHLHPCKRPRHVGDERWDGLLPGKVTVGL